MLTMHGLLFPRVKTLGHDNSIDLIVRTNVNQSCSLIVFAKFKDNTTVIIYRKTPQTFQSASQFVSIETSVKWIFFKQWQLLLKVSQKPFISRNSFLEYFHESRANGNLNRHLEFAEHLSLSQNSAYRQKSLGGLFEHFHKFLLCVPQP